MKHGWPVRSATVHLFPWLIRKSGGSTSSSSSGSKRELRRQLSPRGSSVDSIISLPDLYLTTGLAALASFYILFYTVILTSLVRLSLFSDPPLPLPTDPAERRAQSWRDGLKRFAYRACRAFVLVNWFVLLGVAGRCTQLALQVRSGLSLSGSDGVGVGIGRESLAFEDCSKLIWVQCYFSRGYCSRFAR